MCPVLIHAAAFEESISKIALIEPLSSYRLVVMNQYYSPRLIPSTVAGALTAYDLPDLAGCIAPRDLLMVNITDQNGDRAEPELIESDLDVVRPAYSSAQAENRLRIENLGDGQNIESVFSSWLKK